MLHAYRFFFAGILFFLSLWALANVGVVEGSGPSKVAACTNNPQSVHQDDDRNINPANVVANLGVTVREERPQKRKSRRRGQGRGATR